MAVWRPSAPPSSSSVRFVTVWFAWCVVCTVQVCVREYECKMVCACVLVFVDVCFSPVGARCAAAFGAAVECCEILTASSSTAEDRNLCMTSNNSYCLDMGMCYLCVLDVGETDVVRWIVGGRVMCPKQIDYPVELLKVLMNVVEAAV